MINGQIMKSLRVFCGNCFGNYEDTEYEENWNTKDFEDYLRACLWQKTGRKGWICSDCRGKLPGNQSVVTKLGEVETFPGKKILLVKESVVVELTEPSIARDRGWIAKELEEWAPGHTTHWAIPPEMEIKEL